MHKPILDGKLLTVAEAAKRLDINYSQLYRMIGRGEVPTFELGRRSYVLASWVDSLKEQIASAVK